MRMLISEDHLQCRVAKLALEIDSYYEKQDWYRRTQEPVVVIGVLAGAMFFMADLVRRMSIRTELDFIRTSTYPGKVTIAQKPKIICSPTRNLHDAHILLVDDILDTGKTLSLIREHVAEPYPEDIRTAVLLRKPGKAPKNVTADFVGFDIADEWIIGYGLDHNGRHREWPAIWSGHEDGHGTSEKETSQCDQFHRY